MLKILNWNVRGLNDPVKKAAVKELIVSHGETKMENFTQSDLCAVGTGRLNAFEAKDSVGASGGIVLLWNDLLWRKVDMARGAYSISVILEDVHSGWEWLWSGVGRSPEWADEDLGRVPDEQWQFIDAQFSAAEVHKATLQSDPDKAPSLDGERFPGLFALATNKTGMVEQFYRGEGLTGGWSVGLLDIPNDQDVVLLEVLIRELHDRGGLTREKDKVGWHPNPRKTFSVHLCYEWWRRERPITESTARKYTEIWKAKIPLKRLAGCSDYEDGKASLEELWNEGRRMRSLGDKSAKAKVSQVLIPAVLWALWISRNHRLF
ncbi:hypothetical protein QJS10_CPA07g00698 [Acorus calamus]|uniref:Uncharacterized protein n=1 Tax=Acorus calamus TaxID=4465 RepID=A0AAV9EGC0_ACOCL|nr:hypothetical protein QJS10_CPA07g00698 [Acorus calamus]